MKETMNVHKALIELKLLDKRIESDITQGTYIETIRGNQNAIKGVKKEECETRMKSMLQSVTDKMTRYDALKKALMLSNSITDIVIGNKTMKVSEVLAMKKYGLVFKESLLKELQKQYRNAIRIVETSESNIEEMANEMALGLFHEKDKNVKFDEIMSSTKKNYIDANQVKLVNPNEVENKIKELQDEIDVFTSEVDASLSTSNALTIIEFEY